MAKRELTVTLETVTPMFLAGIDQNRPELRPPSVLGQLRYWLRAALGSVVGNDLKVLKQAEAEVFGDTTGTGAVQIKRLRWQGQIPDPIQEPALPHHHQKNRQAWMWGFPAGEKFELTLTQNIDNSATWLAAISALLLMVSFGGLGRRCRRGWGSLCLVETDTSQAYIDEGWSEVLASRSPDFANHWLVHLDTTLAVAEVGIEQLHKKFNIQHSQIKLPAPYTIASSKWIKPLVTKKVYSSYVEAIRDFHQIEHNFKAGKEFGSATPRQSSPLWVRVLPVAKPQKGFVLAMTFFDTQFDNRNAKRIQEFLQKWEKAEVP